MERNWRRFKVLRRKWNPDLLISVKYDLFSIQVYIQFDDFYSELTSELDIIDRNLIERLKVGAF